MAGKEKPPKFVPEKPDPQGMAVAMGGKKQPKPMKSSTPSKGLMGY